MGRAVTGRSPSHLCSPLRCSLFFFFFFLILLFHLVRCSSLVLGCVRCGGSCWCGVCVCGGVSVRAATTRLL